MAYRNVLLGEQSYIQVNSFDGTMEEAFMQSEISPWYGYVFEVPLRFVAFSVADLDADGSPEMLLKLSDDFGFELLRYEGGQVYGYPFVARAMEAVTADGEIHGSNGAEDFGWYRISFDTDHQPAIAIVCWQYDDPDAGLRYTIGDAEATEAEFKDAQRGTLEQGKLALDRIHCRKPSIWPYPESETEILCIA